MQFFMVTRSYKEYEHTNRVIESIIGVEGTLTKAMELQSKNPGSQISVKNY